MLNFRQFLVEGRSHPELNPKLSTIEQLRKYKDDPDISITFTQEQKVGINPNYQHGTPIGVYAYPLKDSWARYEIESKNSLKDIPFCQKRQFIYVIKTKPGVRILVTSKYTKEEAEKDLDKLKTLLIKNKFEISEEEIDLTISRIKSDRDISRGYFRKILYAGIYEISQKIGIGFTKKAATRNKLYNLLGYDVIYDDCGAIDGTFIYKQIGFLNPKSYKIIDKIENKEYIHNYLYVNERSKEYTGNWDDLGIWKYGIFNGGTWGKGVWENGIFKNGTWIRGIWKNGIWQNGTWQDGEWKNGKWRGGKWMGGFWQDGTWDNGEWYGGIIYSKKFYTDIESKVNPKIFYELEKKVNSLERLKEKANA